MEDCPSGHTEDGLLFYCTFDKYSDGNVVLSGVEAIPTWVYKYPGGSGYQYTIYPIEKLEDCTEKYGFNGGALSKSKASYKRTVKIISRGLKKCQKELGNSYITSQ